MIPRRAAGDYGFAARRARARLGSPARDSRRPAVTLVWFVIWFICNIIGGPEPLIFDPVNGWAGTLLLVVALDLAAAHATAGARRKG